MKLVIIGGNERMVCKYADVCKCHGCETKILVKENGTLKKKIAAPTSIKKTEAQWQQYTADEFLFFVYSNPIF